MCASARNVNIPPTPTQKLTYAHGLLWHVAPKTWVPGSFNSFHGRWSSHSLMTGIHFHGCINTTIRLMSLSPTTGNQWELIDPNKCGVRTASLLVPFNTTRCKRLTKDQAVNHQSSLNFPSVFPLKRANMTWPNTNIALFFERLPSTNHDYFAYCMP